jgi:hypothetical protein
MSNLLNNNVFIQQSKEKYNPDILSKKGHLEKERLTNIFKENKNTYNSITNQIPDNIRSPKDLELKKDLPINNVKNIIAEKNQERLELDQLQAENNKLKRTNIKKISFDDLVSKENSTIHNNLKNEHTDFVKSKDNKNKYDNIVNNLKDLGILK